MLFSKSLFSDIVFYFFFLLIDFAGAQSVDYNVCPLGLVSTSDPNWQRIPQRFEIISEVAAADGAGEVTEAFSAQRDAVVLTEKGVIIRVYWNFDTNEQFTILNEAIDGQVIPICARTSIDANTATSNIVASTLVKPSVLLGYDARGKVNMEFGIVSNGTSTIRGIPVNVFQSCFLVKDLQATVAATYYMTDPNQFQEYLIPSNHSIPLQINVAIGRNNGGVENYQYNIFRFIPNPRMYEERQALETPSGVFCRNRTNTKPVPTDIPERLSVNSEAMIPFMNSSILSSHELYDKFFQFVRFDAWLAGGIHYTEMHDYGTGLSYRYNHETRQCNYTDIDLSLNDAVQVEDHPELIQMRDGLQFFLMDDIILHYTGEKRCRDRVMCHVWIGEKPYANGSGYEHREWYWAFRFNDQVLENWIPIKLIFYNTDARGKRLSSFETNLFNFRRNPMTVFEIDYTLADCYRSLGPAEKFNYAIVSFEINNEKNYPVMQNLANLQFAIWTTLTFSLEVRPIRISHIIIDHEGTSLYVSFTLLDVPPRYGPVEFPIREFSIEHVLQRLERIIDSNGLAFRAKTGTKEVFLRAKERSLNVVAQTAPFQTTPRPGSNPGTITNVIVRKSGGKITGMWIGFIAAGIMIGLVGGFFIFRATAARS